MHKLTRFISKIHLQGKFSKFRCGILTIFFTSLFIFFVVLQSQEENDNDLTSQTMEENILETMRDKYLHPPSSRPYNLASNLYYKSQENGFSWPFIDHYLRLLFQNQVGGFFIEAGALDGEFLSNTLRLEKEQNWTGLLIEPNKYSFQKLLTKNRKSWASNTCLSTVNRPKIAKMVLRKIKNVLESPFHPWVFSGSTHELGYTLGPSYNSFFSFALSSVMKVQCFPLFTYLKALNQYTVDFVSLDIQGAERQVLRTIPFSKINIRSIVVESSYSGNFDDELVSFFRSNDFYLLACSAADDYIFVHKDGFPGLAIPKDVTCNTYLEIEKSYRHK